MGRSIFYTHDIFSSQKRGGISRYFNELTKEIPNCDPSVRMEVFAGWAIGNLEGKVGIPALNIPHTRFARHWLSERWQKRRIGKFRPDFIHVTYPFQPTSNYDHPLVITIHDMVPEIFPQRLDGRATSSALKREYCERASLIIAVSESTKRDLLRLFPVDERKVRVVHHGVAQFVRPEVMALKLEKPYFLYVGTMEPYKNFQRLWEAFSGSAELSKSYDLVVIGTQEPQAASQSASLRYMRGGDDLLASLYLGATALVYPSECEGFGMPLLEAMVHSCPVLCSRIPPFEEVAGEAAYYFDPKSVEDIRSAMEAITKNSSLRKDLISKGNERSPLFTWNACARSTLAAYNEVLGP
jgi:glycosyltransferase involved in cell wall biosynthesis